MAKLSLLLGQEHSEPSEFAVRILSSDIVLGISSVVDKSWKTHNRVNNEDACGIYYNSENSDLIAMVADAHDGYVASSEAVRRFPMALFQHLQDRLNQDSVMQAYLETIFDLYDALHDVGSKSGVIYEREGLHPVKDMSSTTFHSVVRIESNYYSIGCGDSFTAIVRDGGMKVIEPNCGYFMGYANPREEIKKKMFEYREKREKIRSVYVEKRKGVIDQDEDARLFEEEMAASSKLQDELDAMPMPPLDWSCDYVRQVIPVQKLAVLPGDVIFQCTDGINLKTYIREDKHPTLYIGRAFCEKPLAEAVEQIFQGIQQRKFQTEGDNVALTAIRVT